MEGEARASLSFVLFVRIVPLFVGCLLNLTPIILGDSGEYCSFALATGQVIGGGAPMSEKVCE